MGQLEYCSIQGASVAMVTMLISPHSPASIMSVGSTQLSVSPNTGCICGQDGKHRTENGLLYNKITEAKCEEKKCKEIQIFRMLKQNGQSGVLILLDTLVVLFNTNLQQLTVRMRQCP